jgi:hypothetical protein
MFEIFGRKKWKKKWKKKMEKNEKYAFFLSPNYVRLGLETILSIY